MFDCWIRQQYVGNIKTLKPQFHFHLELWNSITDENYDHNTSNYKTLIWYKIDYIQEI